MRHQPSVPVLRWLGHVRMRPYNVRESNACDASPVNMPASRSFGMEMGGMVTDGVVSDDAMCRVMTLTVRATPAGHADVVLEG